jgi:Rieske Fe-S protein
MKKLGEKEVTRRIFLDYVVKAVGTFTAAVVGLPLIGYLVSPAVAGAKKEEWVQLGPVEDFKPGPPKMVKFTSFVKDGWIEKRVQRTVWVVTRDGKSFTVWNPRCTHLGCAIYWDEEDQKLKSPCHGGVFDPVDGRVLAGPPPRPLDTLPARIEGGKLSCIYMDFQLGIPKKVPL